MPFDIAPFLRRGDRVLVGQGAAEPPELVESLISASETVPGLTAICGYTASDKWASLPPGQIYVASYVAHGSLRALAEAGRLDIVPAHLSQMESVIRGGEVPIDAVILQVGPKDVDGCYNLGATVDYVSGAAEQARAVLVTVNPNMPRTKSSRRLHESLVTATFDVVAPLLGSPARAADETERRLAANVAQFVRDGSTVQLGAGALAEAIAAELIDRRRLRVRSGLVGDWLVDLYEAGSIDSTAGSCVVSMALGSDRLYRFVDGNEGIEFAPSQDLIDHAALARCDHFVAMNSAVEVDLLGQVNSEMVGDRYVGAVGGQVDFFRATRVSRTGTTVVAAPSTTRRGDSRIVAHLNGPVTTLKNDYDVVVTEWGVAEIGSRPLSARIEALIGIAHPDHRDALRSSKPAQTWSA
jgi:acyl-CoA hydrolase